ncbi:M14 family zinc carboxypeptidase [Thorsellia kenyensis]|uniref:M14 family zinc carboxypeptidase n=1 Tax=Thorsellia kenyensis TaxID=1549888 RepID=A0ABV6C8E6_9GAMM
MSQMSPPLKTILLEKKYARLLKHFSLATQEVENKKIEVWVFDDIDTQREMEKKWRDIGIDISFMSAYKPLVHQLMNVLRQAENKAIRAINIYYPRHELVSEKRFLLECYPIASCYPDITFTFIPQKNVLSDQIVAAQEENIEKAEFELSTYELNYLIEAHFLDNTHKQWSIFAPNRIKREHTGELCLSQCGWIKITDKKTGKIEKNAPIDTEFELVFDEIIKTIRSEAKQTLQRLQQKGQLAKRPLFFQQLAITIELPYQELKLNVDEEVISLQEALHEEVYFSLLELLQYEAKPYIGDSADRTLQVGQIIPFIKKAKASAEFITLRIESLPCVDNEIKISDLSIGQSVDNHILENDLESNFKRNIFNNSPAEEHNSLDISAMKLSMLSGPMPQTKIDSLLAAILHFNTSKAVIPYVAKSVLGRTIQGYYVSGEDSAVLISGAQHANETTGPVGAIRAVEQLLLEPTCHLAITPIENPDGYNLHQELIQDFPWHIHHAARYTALGDDLEYRDSAPFYEKAIRYQALKASGATQQSHPFKLHINLHGYPSHEWTRPLTGYIPKGFELWTIPKGFFLIIRHHKEFKSLAEELIQAVTADLNNNSELKAYNQRQIARYEMYAGELPFRIINGFSCLISEDQRHDIPVTLITEYPDETIYDEAFIAGHTAQMQTVIAAYKHWQTIFK